MRGKRMNELGGDPVGMSSEDFSKWGRSEIERWSNVAKAADIKPQ